MAPASTGTATAAFQTSAVSTLGSGFLPTTSRLVCGKRGGAATIPAATRPSTSGRRATIHMKVYSVEVLMDNKKHMIDIDESLTLLEGIEEYGLEVLYSCRAGVCVTCAAKLLSGEIDPGFASITEDLKDDGYVLTCSAYPRSEGIKLEMNHFDDAYERQYGQYEKEKAQ